MRRKKRSQVHTYIFNGTRMRSSWEVNIARLLTLEKIPFLYEPKRFVIDENTTYLPDFFLPDYNAFLEVKGRLRTADMIKMNKFSKNGETLYLLRKQEYLKIIEGRLSLKDFLDMDRFLI